MFDRHRPPELLLRDAGRRLHLWDVDLVFYVERHMYLAPMILAIEGSIDAKEPPNPLVLL